MAKKDSSADKLVNLQAAQLAAQVANYAAQLEFQKTRFQLLEMPQWQTQSQLDRDKFAFEKAQAEYEKAFQEASITGTYQGKPTIQYLTEVAKMTGVINGEQTLEGKLSDAQVAQINATIMNTQRGMDLEYEKQGFNVRQYDETHAMALQKQQADLTGFVNGLPTFEREQWQANQGQAYLNMIANLRGPENAFAQLKVLQNTPDALRQMALGWAGQFSGQQQQGMAAPPPATLAGQLNPYQPQVQATGVQGQQLQQGAGVPGGPMVAAYQPPVPTGGMVATDPNIGMTTAGAPVPGYSVDPIGAQAPMDAYNYEASNTGGTRVYPPGVQAPPNGVQVSTYQPLTTQTQQQLTQQSQDAGLAAMPAPGQINAHEYNKATGYEKALGWAGYENQGWDKGVAQELFQRSLPKYGVGANTTGTVKV